VGENCRLVEPATLRPFYTRIRECEQVGDGEAARRRWIGLQAVEVSGIETDGLKSTDRYSSSGGCDRRGWARQKAGDTEAASCRQNEAETVASNDKLFRIKKIRRRQSSVGGGMQSNRIVASEIRIGTSV
jgi:hypothetical protein